MIEFKPCKGTGKAKGSGCGEKVKSNSRKYGLCQKCYAKWLFSSDAGKEIISKAMSQGKNKLNRNREAQRKKEKESLQDRRYWLKIAQRECNAYIRARDKDKPCCACGNEIKGIVHASHYLSQGNHSALRFHEDNIWAGCYKCNVQLSGNLIEYRKRLIKNIGLERVEWLEENGRNPKKWEIDELKELIEYFKQKTKDLCKAQQEH